VRLTSDPGCVTLGVAVTLKLVVLETPVPVIVVSGAKVVELAAAVVSVVVAWPVFVPTTDGVKSSE
jgi:hypothetical protein